MADDTKNYQYTEILQVADLVMDPLRHTVARGNRAIRLTRKEFTLLEYFMRNHGVLLTRAMILEHVWDANADPFTNTVEAHIRFLRQKVDGGSTEKLIETVHGYGYRFGLPQVPR